MSVKLACEFTTRETSQRFSIQQRRYDAINQRGREGEGGGAGKRKGDRERFSFAENEPAVPDSISKGTRRIPRSLPDVGQ